MREHLRAVIVQLARLMFVVVLLLIEGFVIECMWNWFVAPIGVRRIGLAQAIGLGLFFAAVLPSRLSDLKTRRTFEESMYHFGYTLGFAVVLLALGWGVHTFLAS